MPSKDKYIDRKTSKPGVRELVDLVTGEVISIYIWYYGPFNPKKGKKPKLQTSAIPDPRHPAGERPFKNITEAAKYRNKLLNQIDEQQYVSSDMTLADVLDYFYEKKVVKMKLGTQRSYAGIISRIKKHQIAQMSVNLLKHHHINEYLDELLTYLKPGSVKVYKTVICCALDYAYGTEVIGRTPTKAVDVVEDDPVKTDPPSGEEIVKLLTDLQKRFNNNPFYMDKIMYVFEHLSCFAGPRINELDALKWADFNEEESYIVISKTVLETVPGLPIQDATKNNSIRKIYLLPSTVSILQAFKTHCRMRLMRQGMHLYDEHFIFAEYDYSTGLLVPDRHIHPTRLRRWHYKILKELGLPKRKPHANRHAVSTLMQMETGTSPRIVQELLGHYDVATTENIYTHVPKKRMIEETEKLSEYFASLGYHA